MERATTRNNLLAAALVLAYAGFAGLVFNGLTYRGYGETPVDSSTFLVLFALISLTVPAAALVITTALGAVRIPNVLLACVAWLPSCFVSWFVVAAAACSSSAHRCPFS